MSKDNKAYTVGYKQPPKRTQFKKGQSGNARGRPKKQQASTEDASGILPTAAAIREEGARQITIREGDGLRDIPTREAVLLALRQSALKGGVLAQRTYLQYQLEEDEREARRKRENFDFWQNYVAEVRREIRQCEARNDTTLILPHPDDIKFNYRTLDVDIVGPCDEAELRSRERLRRMGNLCMELSIYLGEEKKLGRNGEESRIGVWFMIYVQIQGGLPSRMRGLTEEESVALEQRALSPTRVWAAYLREECEEFDLPFPPRGKSWPSYKLSDFGLSVEQLR